MNQASFTTHLSFDLYDFTTEVKEVYVAAQMAQSTAWRIDTLIRQTTNTIFRAVREALRNGEAGSQYDSLQDISNAMKEMEFAEAAFAEAGLDNTTLLTLQQLVHQRDRWHDLAKEYVGMTYDYRGNAREYEIPSLDDIFFEKLETKSTDNVRISQHLQNRLRVQSERRAEAYDAKEMANELYERKLERERRQQLDINAMTMDRAPAVFNVFNLAMQAEVGEVTAGFQTLPIETQRVLIANAQQAAERADDFAAKERNMTDIEYDGICLCAIGVIKALRGVLAAPKFVASQRTREAVGA